LSLPASPPPARPADGLVRRIEPPGWLLHPAVRAVCAALGAARFVGGAVRDTLLGRAVGDLDMATPLAPDTVIERLGRAGIRTVPTGLRHGTVTAIADGVTIEVTTLRRDVETDGRRAVVAFTADWAADAARRDFTMNALYLDPEGGLWDPVGGLADCLAGRVRFVGAPARRIAEDRLRLLRFYRFQAHYGREPADPAARAACAAAAGDLALLSGERIRSELLRLLAAPDPVPTLALMVEDGVLGRILPMPAALDRLARLIRLEPAADPLLRLACLLPDGSAVDRLAAALKLSGAEHDRLAQATGPLLELDAEPAAQRRALHRLGGAAYRDRLLLAAAAAGRDDRLAALLGLAQSWPVPALPIGGTDVLALGVPPGNRVGALLRAVEAWWIARDFQPDRAALLARLAELAREHGRPDADFLE
jgi:poly(A) polymerase